MDIATGTWLLILIALLAANLPFLNQRLLAVFKITKTIKPVWVCLLELIFLYFIVGVLACMIEAYTGQVKAQGWELYAVTACLFLVFSFPGFVYQYLFRRASLS
jgi:hypothetical protein